MHFLVDDAIERHASVVQLAGLGAPKRRTETQKLTAQLDRLKSSIGPLKIPSELEYFWTNWEPKSFEAPTRRHAFLCGPDTSLQARREQGGLYPEILLPIVREERMIWAMELETSSHPGTRILEVDFEMGTRVLAVGIGHMLDCFSDSIESSIANGTSVDDYEFAWLPSYEHRERMAAEVDQSGAATIDVKAKWPSHWLEAAGITPDALAIRGKTHSIWEFDVAREKSPQTTATLHGTFNVGLGGGPLGGAVGKLRDGSGSIQIFVPDSCPNFGGINGPAEIDVIGHPQSGQGLGSLPAPGIAEIMGFAGNEAAYLEFFKNLFDAIHGLDVSVIATAIRPLEK